MELSKDELRVMENNVRDFVKEELDTYPYYEEYSLTHEYDNVFNLEVTNAPSIVVFRATPTITQPSSITPYPEWKIEIELTDNNWVGVEYFNWTVKYFWMKLLQTT